MSGLGTPRPERRRMSTIQMPRLEQAACVGATATESLCRTCWDRPECLAWALAAERDGYWAGYSAPERAIMRREFGIPTPGVS